jgi:hypothetical protein
VRTDAEALLLAYAADLCQFFKRRYGSSWRRQLRSNLKLGRTPLLWMRTTESKRRRIKPPRTLVLAEQHAFKLGWQPRIVLDAPLPHERKRLAVVRQVVEGVAMVVFPRGVNFTLEFILCEWLMHKRVYRLPRNDIIPPETLVFRRLERRTQSP